MKAIVTSGFGPPEVLQFKEVEKPEPRANEILIKVKASTVTRGDVILRKMHPMLALPLRLFGVRVKKIPGHEFSGVIEKVGRDVTMFNEGDQVFGTTTGLSIGANAEYICLPEKNKSSVLAIKPSNVTHDEAAALPIGGMTALYLLEKGDIQTGQKVLIYGASGSVGTYAVQLAKHFGQRFLVCAAQRTSNWLNHWVLMMLLITLKRITPKAIKHMISYLTQLERPRVLRLSVCSMLVENL